MPRAKKWSPAADPSVVIEDEGGVRWLHVGGRAIQSAMRMSEPDALELDYTQAMMSFLLFVPQPRDVAMIGLGGGSIAKFIHRRMPETRIAVAEIRAGVVSVAREWFELPPDDARLSVSVIDGAWWLRDAARAASNAASRGAVDVLLVDGFDDGRQPEALCTAEFYADAAALLRPGGVMAVNFMADDRQLPAMAARIGAAFGAMPLRMPAADGVNTILLALRSGDARAARGHDSRAARGGVRIAWRTLQGRALALQQMFGLPFPRFVTGLKKMNPHTDRWLALQTVAEAGGGRRPAGAAR